MEVPMENSFAGIPSQYLAEFKETVGATYTYGSYTSTTLTHVLVLIVTTVLFYSLAAANMSRKKF